VTSPMMTSRSEVSRVGFPRSETQPLQVPTGPEVGQQGAHEGQVRKLSPSERFATRNPRAQATPAQNCFQRTVDTKALKASLGAVTLCRVKAVHLLEPH
jgi:hypothetical protein